MVDRRDEFEEETAHADDSAMQQLLDGVRDGDATRSQCAPDEPDPISGETADEAWEAYQRTGLVNPFHAIELQSRQERERASQACQHCGEPVGPLGHGRTTGGAYCGLMCALEDSAAEDADNARGRENGP